MLYKKCASSYMVSSCLTNALRTIMTRPSFQVRFASFQLSVDLFYSSDLVVISNSDNIAASVPRLPITPAALRVIGRKPRTAFPLFVTFTFPTCSVGSYVIAGYLESIKNFSTNCFHWKLFVFLKDLGGVFLVWGRAVI